MNESREYPSRPFVGVGVVVLRGDSVLLIRRGKPPKAGEWSLPGGSQDVGETVRETAAREVREETGVEIGAPVLLDVLDAIIPDEAGKVQFHYTLVDFEAEWVSGEPSAADDAEHAEWVPLARLDEIELWEKTREIIEKAAAIRDGTTGGSGASP
ncbi:MAG: NUDIX hydrolase [Alkalispirochaetaceae bacterium]